MVVGETEKVGTNITVCRAAKVEFLLLCCCAVGQEANVDRSLTMRAESPYRSL